MPPGTSVHGISQARTLEWGNIFLQGIFPTQGSNPRLLHLLHWQADSRPLVPSGKPQVLRFYTPTIYLFLLDTKLYCMWSLLTELSVENVSVSDVFLLNDELIIQRLENMITVSTY